MANNELEAPNRLSVTGAHHSGTKMIDSTGRKLHQGVTLEDLSFAKVQKDKPLVTDIDLERGKIIFTNQDPTGERDDFNIYIPVKSYGKFDAQPDQNLTNNGVPRVSSPFLPKVTGNTVLGTTFSLQLDSDSAVKLQSRIKYNSSTDVYDVIITGNPTTLLEKHDSTHRFSDGDILVFPKGWNKDSTIADVVNFTVLETGKDLSSLLDDTDAGIAAGTYPNVATTTSGDGQGLTLDIIVTGTTITSVIVKSHGNSYKVGDTITINKNDIGGTGGGTLTSDALTANDVVAKDADPLYVTIDAADLPGVIYQSPLVFQDSSATTLGVQVPVVTIPTGAQAGVLEGAVLYDSATNKLKVCTAVAGDGTPTYETITSA
jgi:hypothetical protein